MIDDKMIKWAIKNGFYDDSDVPNLNEIDERLISLAYKLHNSEKIPASHYTKIITEDGTEQIVTYEGYLHESY